MERLQLREFALFKDLSEEALDELAALMRSISYRAGDLIFQEGGPSAGLHIVLSGLIQYGKFSGRHNRRRMLKILGPGDAFGEEVLFYPELACPYVGSARALIDSSVAFITKNSFLAFMESYPIIARHMCEQLARQLRIFECKLVELSYEPLEQNLLRLLLTLMERFGVRKEEGICLEVPFSRQDLAELLGAHLDTVIHELSKLRDQGLLAFRKHCIVVLNGDRLRELAEPHTTCLEEKLF
jgi:CRP-like cAMP-binding protein